MLRLSRRYKLASIAERCEAALQDREALDAEAREVRSDEEAANSTAVSNVANDALIRPLSPLVAGEVPAHLA